MRILLIGMCLGDILAGSLFDIGSVFGDIEDPVDIDSNICQSMANDSYLPNLNTLSPAASSLLSAYHAIVWCHQSYTSSLDQSSW